MTTQLSAKPVIEAIQSELKERVEKFKSAHGRAPKLVVVLVGNDPASVIYTTNKGKKAVELGMEHDTVVFNGDVTPERVKAAVDRLNKDPKVDGILIQRPLPKSFREEEVMYWVSPAKDVDAFHPENTGRLSLGLPCLQPCTPTGIMTVFKHYGIDLAGKLACVIGRSSIVGKPMAALLLQANATVLQCHSKTSNLKAMTQQAEILIVAAGKPGLIDETYVRNGAVVVDVGIHRNAQNKVVGDVQYDRVAPKASAITPVPGGVGPMTIITLMQNTVLAAEMRELDTRKSAR